MVDRMHAFGRPKQIFHLLHVTSPRLKGPIKLLRLTGVELDEVGESPQQDK